MRIAWFFIGTFLLLSSTPIEELFVIKEKEIRVKGVTSIGRFECAYGSEKLSDTLFTGNIPKSKHLDFVIPVDRFGCGNFLLNRDFRATIKAEEFPTCKVTVRSLTRKRNMFVSDLDVNLAGKQLFLDDVVFRHETNKLIGEVDLSFEMLDLVPPKKLGGLIQVEDKLSLQIIMGM
ncbi:hypothetical protein ADIS_2414 [Lunatimonas lonarensis]|jgi:hypothetical protein|uniref:Lipid/polyisoprenoid-binding YceI-like domain-containing protein n=1 Tax=Lunatimonas lonarensis TaxID=1232681 RepID=R7ZSZ2_9BACT|nr:hypothetical protein [Lunatimonas lonarensis]EON77104.1 hypothetical protein ADIS_2414 [Lunatimonas lonarensis]